VIERTFDPARVNVLLNDDRIRPTIGGEGVLDAGDLLADKCNICLMDGENGAMFIWRGPGVYEGHSFFTVKGREAIALGKQILSALDADMVWGATPLELRAARWFNRKIGFRSLGIVDRPEGRCELFEKRF
tara:strand:- start:3715 stop:4107 length:393 start_codon:yes stop_codon:yes gene_type:complete